MKLVFIHGRDQQEKNKDELRDIWFASLVSGLRKSGLDFPEDVEIIFPYYGDLLINLVAELKSGNDLTNIVAKGDYSQVDTEFYLELITQLASNAGIELDDLENVPDDNLQEKGVQNTYTILTLARLLNKIDFLGSKAIKLSTRDVFLYLTNEILQYHILSEIKKSIPNEPFLIVGHSLGSIIAYHILLENEDYQAQKFITVGSPLGVAAVRKRISPIEMPPCISTGNWYNAFDKKDIVSLKPLDEHNFKITPSISNNNSVINTSDNHHDITGYLSDKNVAKEIYDALIIDSKII